MGKIYKHLEIGKVKLGSRFPKSSGDVDAGGVNGGRPCLIFEGGTERAGGNRRTLHLQPYPVHD